MLFERAATFLSLYLTRRLSRYRALTILSIYAATACLIALISYYVSFILVLYPLANLFFTASGNLAAAPMPQIPGLPSSAAQYAIGAAPQNRTAELRARQMYVNYGSLPMRRPEADLLMSYLRPSDVYLEYGASGTTLAFPMLVRQSFAIEHDAQVCSGISSEMHRHPALAARLRAFCATVPPGRAGWALRSQFEEGTYRAFHNYVDFPRTNLSNVKFDRVLINGRARVACALRILPQLRPTSLVFFHDYFLRPKHYSSVLTYFEEVARIVAHGPVSGYTDDPMGMLVLRPKKEYIEEGMSDVPVAHVNAIYDANYEKEPTEDSASMAAAFDPTGLSRSDEGGFPYYELKRNLARETTHARIVLDLIMLPFIVVTYYVLQALFRKIFLEALSSSGARSSRLFAGDFRAAMPWAFSRNTAGSAKAHSKTLPVTTVKPLDGATGSTGKAE